MLKPHILFSPCKIFQRIPVSRSLISKKVVVIAKLFCVMVASTLIISCGHSKSVKKDKTPENSASTSPYKFIGKHQAKAMVLGVFHFDNPGLDDYKPKYPFNILEQKRQEELEILLNQISEYKPTKILLERNRVLNDSSINNQYQNYLLGKFKLDKASDEIYQIGFKLAKKLGHKRIYCSDASAEWFGIDLDWGNFNYSDYLKSKDQFEKTYRYDYQSIYKKNDSLKTVQSLLDRFVMINDPMDRLFDHQAYLTEVILGGAGDNYLGADSVAKWYRRNLRIYANAYDLTNFNHEERLLLIYGSGHVWQLRQLFNDSPDFKYIEPNLYLKK